MLRLAQVSLLLTILILLASCSPALSVKMGSQTFMMRENKLGTAIVPMEDIEVLADQLQDDHKTIIPVKVLIKNHIVIRVGIEYIGREDQILTLETKKFSAMVPDKDGNLVLSDFTLDAKTGVKIGVAKWEEPVNNSTEKK